LEGHTGDALHAIGLGVASLGSCEVAFSLHASVRRTANLVACAGLTDQVEGWGFARFAEAHDFVTDRLLLVGGTVGILLAQHHFARVGGHNGHSGVLPGVRVHGMTRYMIGHDGANHQKGNEELHFSGWVRRLL